MKRSLFSITLDASKLDGLIGDLGRLNAEGLGDQLVRATNEAAQNAYELSRRAITKAVNLSDGYVNRKVEFKKASASKPQAEIIADGAITMLSHYGAMERFKPVRWPDPIDGMKIGPWRKGYVPRVSDEKPDGMSVEVKTGSRKTMPGAFTIKKGGTVVKDRDGNPLLFIQRPGTKGQGSMVENSGRTGHPKRKVGRSKIQPLVGPSVYQLFRTAAQAIEDDVRDDLEARVARVATQEFEKVLK